MLIRSSANGTLKDIRQLRRSKGDRAILEGPKLIAEALASGKAPESVLMTPEFAESEEGKGLQKKLPASPLLVEGRLLRSLADADSPQGALAVLALPRHGVGCLPLRPDGLYVFLEKVQDPGNLGAIARVAEAVGCAGLALSKGSVHPNHPRALRASAGSLLRLPVAVSTSPADLSQHLTELSPKWLALAPRGGTSLYDNRWQGALVLALGSEGSGFSPTLLASASDGPQWQGVTIPLEAPVESLNVAVAAAVTLFEIRRCRGFGEGAP